MDLLYISMTLLQAVNPGYILMNRKPSNNRQLMKNLPTKVVLLRSTSKRIIGCLAAKSGHVTTFSLENRRIVNAEWYTTISLPEVINELRKKTLDLKSFFSIIMLTPPN